MSSRPSPTPLRLDLRVTRRAARGFTLLEIMLVVAIIALLLAAGFQYLGDVFGAASSTVVKADINTFNQKIKMYEAWTGTIPTSEQGLGALVTMPQSEPKPSKWYQFMEKLPKDPWKRDYIYAQPGVHNPQGFDVYSKGKDGVANTSDDVGNWD